MGSIYRRVSVNLPNRLCPVSLGLFFTPYGPQDFILVGSMPSLWDFTLLPVTDPALPCRALTVPSLRDCQCSTVSSLSYWNVARSSNP